jgi:hypothetical protein
MAKIEENNQKSLELFGLPEKNDCLTASPFDDKGNPLPVLTNEKANLLHVRFTLKTEVLNSGRIQSIRSGDTLVAEKVIRMDVVPQGIYLMILINGTIVIGSIAQINSCCITISGLNPNKILYPDSSIEISSIVSAYRATACCLNRSVDELLRRA